MNSIEEIDPMQWFSRTEQHTFKCLTGPLKETLGQYLNQFQEHDIEIVAIALNAIRLSDKQDEVFIRQREKFFIRFLSDAEVQTLPTWNKILEIAQKGFLGQFLQKIDNKKKDYHTGEKLISLINQFHEKDLPLLLQEQKKSQFSDPAHFLTPSIVQENYDKIYRCQTYFALPKLINEFLSSLPPQQKWDDEVYRALFYTLDVTYRDQLDDFVKLELCHVLFLLHPHPHKRKTSFERCSVVDIKEFLNSCMRLQDKVGEEVLSDYLFSLKQATEWTLSQAIRSLKFLLEKRKDRAFYTLLDKWKKQGLQLAFLDKLAKKNVEKVSLEEAFFQDSLPQRLARFKKDPTVTQPLNDQELERIAGQYQVIEKLCFQYKQLEFHELLNEAHAIRELAKRASLHEEDHLKLIAIGRMAIWLEFGIYPYSTQVLALLALLLDGKSRQGQVKTGEGKSTIVALWAFVMAMECRAVDIITSARYLAIRDHEKFATFFRKCGITTSHICHNQKQPEHFGAQVLYGPAFDFEFAWMEDLLWGSKLYQKRLENPYIQRNFDVVMVDESDNLLIDSAKSGARLGYPSEDSYEWIYAPILFFVRQNKEIVENKANLEHLLTQLKAFLKDRLTPEQQRIVHHLPDDQLRIWLSSAHRALFEVSLDKEYIIKEKRNRQGDLKRTIQIVDLGTGRISKNSRWSNGIHEFLEIKHDLPIKKESLTPFSLYHSVFYKFYHTINALTGTAERFQTKAIYQIETFDVPSHRPLQRRDLPILFAQTTEHYHFIIIQNIKDCIQAGRPCLVLCATIKDTKELAVRLMEEQIAVQMLNEVQEEHEHVILNRAGGARRVTIATNTAGRGTDILLSQESMQNGGLHVLLTFYPDSKRVEDQAIGRAGRQGQPGTSQIIVNKEDLEIQSLIGQQREELTDAELIDLLKNQRESKEKSFATTQVFQAELQRFLAQKTENFFRDFRQWIDHVDQDCVLERYAEKLCTLRMVAKKEPNVSSLVGWDILLAEECLALLKKSREKFAWKVFLKKIVERLKKKAIEEWVKNFFKDAESQLMQAANMLGALKSKFDEDVKAKLQQACSDSSSQAKMVLFNLFEEELLRAAREQIEVTKKEIEQKFDAHQLKWRSYFRLDGSGILVYLKEITTINFFPIIKK